MLFIKNHKIAWLAQSMFNRPPGMGKEQGRLLLNPFVQSGAKIDEPCPTPSSNLTAPPALPI